MAFYKVRLTHGYAMNDHIEVDIELHPKLLKELSQEAKKDKIALHDHLIRLIRCGDEINKQQKQQNFVEIRDQKGAHSTLGFVITPNIRDTSADDIAEQVGQSSGNRVDALIERLFKRNADSKDRNQKNIFQKITLQLPTLDYSRYQQDANENNIPLDKYLGTFLTTGKDIYKKLTEGWIVRAHYNTHVKGELHLPDLTFSSSTELSGPASPRLSPEEIKKFIRAVENTMNNRDSGWEL